MKPVSQRENWVSISKAVVAVVVVVALGGGAYGFDYCSAPCQGGGRSVKHTMCVYTGEKPGKQCRKLDSSKELTEQDKQLILHLHNQLRSKVATGGEGRGSPGPQPSAANMMELVWDNELEEIARRWALQCTYDHDFCRQTKEKVYVGQNVAVTYSSEGFANDLEKMVQNWYDEVQFLPSKAVTAFSGQAGSNLQPIGHYTQLVWAETVRLGCGRVFFDFSDWGMTEMLVCNYGRGGNVNRARIYLAGQPCSGCEPGLACSSLYPGLCSLHRPGSSQTEKAVVPSTSEAAPPSIAATSATTEAAQLGNLGSRESAGGEAAEAVDMTSPATEHDPASVSGSDEYGDDDDGVEDEDEDEEERERDVTRTRGGHSEESGASHGTIGILEMFFSSILAIVVVKFF